MVVEKFAFLYNSWYSHGNSRLIGKDPETGKYSRQKGQGGLPHVQQSMGLQRVGHNLVTEQHQQKII